MVRTTSRGSWQRSLLFPAHMQFGLKWMWPWASSVYGGSHPDFAAARAEGEGPALQSKHGNVPDPAMFEYMAKAFAVAKK